MLNILIHQEMNIISFCILLLFGVYASSVLDKKVKINRIYLALLGLNLMLLGLEIILYMIVNSTGVSVLLRRFVGTLIFALSPVLPYLSLKLVFLYFPNPKKIKKSTKMTFNFMLLLNLFIATVFYNSQFSDVPYELSSMIIPFAISGIYVFYGFYYIIKNKKMLIKVEYIFIISINLISNALILIQFIIQETRFIWISSSFVLILIFIMIQQKELYRDNLTGARNRLALKKCLSSLIKKQDIKISIVMMDLDYFKNINDTYGHSEGDYALKLFVRMLQKVYSDKGLVIRMGGDEFLVLIYNSTEAELNDLLKKMSKLVDKYNNKSIKPYRIKYSCASGVYDNLNITIDQFIHEIDLKMYQNKKNKRFASVEKNEKIFNVKPFI